MGPVARGGQKKGWDQLSPRYRERLEKRGVTETQYESPFFSLQRARGHRPLIREGRRVGGEKAALEQRRRERGALSDSERKFFSRQARKTDDSDKRATARTAFEAMSPSQRSQVMAAQANLARGYRRRRSRARSARRGRSVARAAVGGGGGYTGADYGGFAGGGGGAGGYSYGGQADFGEWYEDEFPDFDDGAELLLYYH